MKLIKKKKKKYKKKNKKTGLLHKKPNKRTKRIQLELACENLECRKRKQENA